MHSKKAIGAAALALMMIAGIANAQTTYDQSTSGSGTVQTTGTTSTGRTSSSNPSVPNTGSGGAAAQTAGMLTATGVIALAGLYLLRRRNVS